MTGISYGGGQSIELAYLRNRIRTPDGSFAPWRARRARRSSIAAAWPRWPWSDLVDAAAAQRALPGHAGRAAGQSLDPVGIEIASYVGGLFALGKPAATTAATPRRAPPAPTPTPTSTGDFALVNAGEPPSRDAQAPLAEIYAHHQGYGLLRHARARC